MYYLLDRHRLSQVTREVYVKTLGNRKPVGDELQRDNIEETLQTVHCLGNLDPLSLGRWEFFVVRVANDNRAATARNHYISC